MNACHCPEMRHTGKHQPRHSEVAHPAVDLRVVKQRQCSPPDPTKPALLHVGTSGWCLPAVAAHSLLLLASSCDELQVLHMLACYVFKFVVQLQMQTMAHTKSAFPDHSASCRLTPVMFTRSIRCDLYPINPL